jgi:hypothetical protein
VLSEGKNSHNHRSGVVAFDGGPVVYGVKYVG